MYIPMNEKEIRRFKLSEPHDVELLVKPLTGDNETFYYDCVFASRNTEDEKVKEKCAKDLFNYFVKGFIYPDTGSKVEFSDDQKATSFFNIAFIADFIQSIDKINSLSTEEKKT